MCSSVGHIGLTTLGVTQQRSRAKSLEGLVSDVVFGGLRNVVVENNSGRIFFAWRVAKVARLWRVTKGGG